MKILRQIVSLLMALLILVSTTGFSVHAHSCAGELQDFSFYEKAEGCSMERQVKAACHATEHTATVQAEPCCENHAFQLEQHEETVELASVKIFKPELKLVAFAWSLVLPLLQENTSGSIIPEAYGSPPIARDIFIFVQSFLL